MIRYVTVDELIMLRRRRCPRCRGQVVVEWGHVGGPQSSRGRVFEIWQLRCDRLSCGWQEAPLQDPTGRGEELRKALARGKVRLRR